MKTPNHIFWSEWSKCLEQLKDARNNPNGIELMVSNPAAKLVPLDFDMQISAALKAKSASTSFGINSPVLDGLTKSFQGLTTSFEDLMTTSVELKEECKEVVRQESYNPKRETRAFQMSDQKRAKARRKRKKKNKSKRR